MLPTYLIPREQPELKPRLKAGLGSSDVAMGSAGTGEPARARYAVSAMELTEVP